MHHTPSMLYRERLLPGLTMILLGIGLFLMVGVAYSAAFGTVAGIALGIIASATYLLIAIASAPYIRVERRENAYFLFAGRAAIDVSLIGSVHELSDVEREQLERGTRSDTAFRISKSRMPVIELAIIDPNDPHGTWCLPSRKPRELIQAISKAQGPGQGPKTP
ncbi:MAG: DUF3093 family protein [Actinomycetia bacterium]|nr:DUF3093 family protein [Actinomycetes bacterium]